MAAPTKLNFKIYQGSTFTETLRWESDLKVYVPITNITKTAPMVVTATNHGIPINWRTNISNVVGMKEANTTDYINATAVTSNTVTFNSINAVNYSTYTAGSGILSYNQPVSLSGYSARMQIREKITSDTFILELTTDNEFIVLDDINKIITINIPAIYTALFDFKTAIYSLELTTGTVVEPFIYGSISLEPDITR
jgi:hypothetical protein